MFRIIESKPDVFMVERYTKPSLWNLWHGYWVSAFWDYWTEAPATFATDDEAQKHLDDFLRDDEFIPRIVKVIQ